jgi:hypothetical protein
MIMAGGAVQTAGAAALSLNIIFAAYGGLDLRQRRENIFPVPQKISIHF